MFSRILACVFCILLVPPSSANTEGDTNHDLKIDIVDLNNVRNNFGGTGLGDTVGSDDGQVTIADLNNVRNNFGAGAGSVLASGSPPPSGDADGDGDVDQDDLMAVRDHFGVFGAGIEMLQGDTLPFDGHVDVFDLNNVRNNLPVPEPPSLVLLAAGAAGLAVLRRKRKAANAEVVV